MDESKTQLYKIIRKITIPNVAIRSFDTGKYSIITRELPAAVSICWPNGTPCIHAEMFLLDVSDQYTLNEVDGGSLKVLASSLSHLIRYCWREKIDFSDLNDQDIKNAINFLQVESDILNPQNKRRQGNTIDRIVNYWIKFLTWLQENLYLDRVVVGTTDQNPQIPLHVELHSELTHLTI